MRKRRGAGRILVVGADPLCCRLMAAALELEGHRVEWTADPVHALTLVQARRYALLVSDVNVPAMLGTALAAKVGRVRLGLPTLLVSALADGHPRGPARPFGFSVLPAPVRVDALAAVAREVVGRPREARVSRARMKTGATAHVE
jgi:DNA-binding NtrC family response regulator